MSPIQFKFSKPPDGLVRRVTFQERPSWDALAAKIHFLYDISPNTIGVSYIDNDGDEVTLSSDEELQDFYQSAVMQRNDGTLTLVKFAVRDLDAFRNDKPLPDTPRTTSAANYRNTFGRSAPVLFEMEVDDGWQPIPSGLAGLFNAAPPHAFVEVLESDADVSQLDKPPSRRVPSNTSTNTLPEINVIASSDKGKGRARSEDFRSRSPDTISSTQSVLAAEAPPKYPIHVFAMKNSSTEGVFRRRGSRSRSSAGFAPLTPTPKSRTPNPLPAKPSGDAQEGDSPLPDLDDMPSPPFNIANDVANLFSTLSIILASHPELSEGIRNIVRNASDGTYWQTHREHVARAADEIRRSAIMGADELLQVATDGRRSAEDVAGRRVADALGSVIRAIADITDTQPWDAHAQPTAGAPTTSTPLREQNAGNSRDDSRRSGDYHGRGGYGRRGTFFGGRGSWGTFGSRWDRATRFPSDLPDHVPPPPGSLPTNGWQPVPPPPPPPPPPSTPPYFGPGAGRFRPDSPPHHGQFPADDALSPQHRSRFGPPPFGPPHSHHDTGEWGFDPSAAREPQPGWHRRHASNWEDTVPPLPPRPTAASAEDAEVTMYKTSTSDSPEAAKQALQAAKDTYIAEKERYRRLREERKKRKMNLSTDSEMKEFQDSPISPLDAQEPIVRPVGELFTAPAPPAQSSTTFKAPQIISNARGPYPQLEMYSVPPRRSHTTHGTDSKHVRDASWGTFGSGVGSGLGSTQAGRTAAANSIVRRLSDMGFTPAQYPVLSQKVEACISARHGEVSKEREDSIVTEIIETLLQENSSRPQGPRASGSGPRPI